ncbi:hypothetical protein P171DRAFT_519497 [Karstenula rhodostoma CBS 690.94]|uniref:Uncharacterized protein n=1 Tax=Karstenula rhodostoma CBS 690.94 TaxID=1392251 RepID=A0A9P4PPW4_9PLEO|nr:hypothetical protein P171DRAFT_519497 [Karstenula rhodostoma CBS 690.94]
MHLFSFRNVLLLLGLAIISQGLYIPSESHDDLALRSDDPWNQGISSSPNLVSRARGRTPKSRGGRRLSKTTPKRPKNNPNPPKNPKPPTKPKPSKKPKPPKNTKAPSVTPKLNPSKTTSKASSSTSDLYCPVAKPTGKPRGKGTSKRPRAVKNPSKKPSGKPTGKKVDVCNYKPTPIPTKAINVCDELVDCQISDESEPIVQDTYKAYKSKIKTPVKSKGGKGTKTTKGKGTKPVKRQQQFSVDISEFDQLAKRGSPRRYKTDVKGVSKLDLYSQDYPSNSDLYTGDGKDLPKVRVQWKTEKLNDIAVYTYKTLPTNINYKELVTEHLIELQTVKMFIETLIEKTGADKVEGAWFEKWWNEDLSTLTVPGIVSVDARPKKATDLHKGTPLGDQTTINDLVFQALGSSENRGDFVLCDSKINTFKMRMWKTYNYMNPEKFENLLKDFEIGTRHSNEVLSVFRTIFGVFSYMNEPEVKKRLVHIYENVKKELSNIPELTKEDKGLDTKWEAFMKAQLETMAEHGREWMRVRYLATKASYQTAMTALETQKGLLERNLGRVTKSDLQGLHENIASLKAKRKKLEDELEAAYEARKPLQTAKYDAIKTKIQKDITAATTDLEISSITIKMLKQYITENKKDTNKAQYTVDTQLIQQCDKMIDVLKADLATLRGFETKTASLKLPTL